MTLPVSIGFGLPGKGSPRPPVNLARDGFTLVEVIVYLGVVMVVIGVGYAALFESMKSSFTLRRNAEEIVQSLRAGENWRSDVRVAREIRFETNSVGQMLHLSGARGEVWYRFADNTVYRRPGNNPWTKALGNVQTSDFTPDPRPTVAAWRWELELQTRSRKSGGVRPRFTFIAVPTGDSAK